MLESASRLIPLLLADERTRARFEADPAAVLREKGIDIPAGVKLLLVEDPESARHLLVPYPAEEPELVGVSQ